MTGQRSSDSGEAARFVEGPTPVHPDPALAPYSEKIGEFVAALTFAGVYIASVTWGGWLIGLALGWIPAYFAAAFGYLIGRYLWWAAILILLGGAGVMLIR